MSMTQSPGCYTPQDYGYMAGCAAEGLAKIVRAKRICKGDIHERLQGSLKDLFDRLCDEQRDIPKNPPAAISGYLMFLKLWERVCLEKGRNLSWTKRGRTAQAHTHLRKKISEFDQFVGQLRRVRKLTPGEQKTADELASLMRHLKKAGNSERYNRYMVESHRGINGDPDPNMEYW